MPDHPGAEIVPSPNRNARRSGHGTPDLVILHYTGMAIGKAALDLLCDPASGVSAHYVVFEDGRIVQCVPEADRAWHAGVSCWQGATDINSRSIGIEIVNGGHDFGLPAFPDAQIDAVTRLLHGILTRHALRPEAVLGHSDVAPGRKRDPGEHFPWDRLAAAGVARPCPARPGPASPHPADPDPRDVLLLQDDLWRLGYATPVDGVLGERTRQIIKAVQRRWRSARVDGIADVETRELVAALLNHRTAST
jgi:N-acetylmuramoyl-L-alanine amidase